MYEEWKDYPNDVLEGRVAACELVKLSCKRYLDFFEKYEFREQEVKKVINFISKLRHWTGQHNNKPFTLLPYQRWMTAAIFGFYERGTNKRVTQYVYIELARKNGKTALVSAWLDYLLVASGENGAEIDMVANSAKQAAICFNMSSNFLQSIDKKGKYFKRYRDNIKFDKTKSFMQVLSSDTTKLDGGNPLCFCLDEAHEQRDSKVYDVMVSGQGARENPLGIIISSAGFNRFGFCYPYRQSMVDVLKGSVENDAYFCAIYTLDDDDDWRDPEVWSKANPSMGVTVRQDYIAQQVKNAISNQSLEVGVRTKNLNQWLSTSNVWLSEDLVLKHSKKIKLDEFNECYGYGGVDLASVSDLTAYSLMIPKDEKFFFKTWYFLPQDTLDGNENSEFYKQMWRRGFLCITDGNVTDYDFVLNKIVESNKDVMISKIAYDKYNATQWATDCVTAGLPVEPYSQALWSFNQPTKEFERLLKSGRIVIDDNPITRWCFRNAALKYDHNENVKPVKGGNDMQKIDGCISMLQALGIYLQEIHYDNDITI